MTTDLLVRPVEVDMPGPAPLSRTAAVVVDGPAAVTGPPGSLLVSSRALPFPQTDWARGLTWSAHDTRASSRALSKYPGATVQCPPTVQHCRPARVAAPTVKAVWPTWLSFTEGCLESEVDDWAAHARAALDADSSAALARYLWTGVSGTTTAPAAFVTESVSFTNQVDIVDTVARPPIQALARLQEAMSADGYRSRLWFHAPDGYLPYLLNNGLIELQGNLYRHGAHVVVLDAGYPVDITGQVASAAGEAWMIASGPVETALSPIQVNEPVTALQCLDPEWEAHRLAIARFAGVPVTGHVKAIRIKLWE